MKNIILFISTIIFVGCGGSNNSSNDNDLAIDNIAPIITLNGEAELTIYQGDDYSELGATAIDDVDGEVPVNISGTVDTATINTYVITYTATDLSSNISTAERYVNVIQKPAKTQLDVMAVYSPEAKAIYDGDIDSRFQHIFSTANTIYQNSNSDIQLNLVYSMEKDLTLTKSSADIINEAYYDTNLQNIRRTNNADFIMFFRPYIQEENFCGFGIQNNILNKDYTLAHTSIDCISLTMAHELGHNMGLAHSNLDIDTVDGIYSYSNGHGVENSFATVMSYAHLYNTNQYVLMFSDPTSLCNGEPCGVEEGFIDSADNARTLKEVKQAASNFY